MKNNFSGFVTANDGSRIFYQTNFDKLTDDSKPPIMFNYGLVCNNGHFEYQLPFFDDLDYPIIIHDYRGHFKSSTSKVENITFDNICKDMKLVLNKLNVKNVIMIGHSMGVNTSIEYALQYPKDVHSMVLISGSLFPPQSVMFDSNFFENFTPIWRWAARKLPNFYEKFWSTTGLNPFMIHLIHDGGFNKKKVDIKFVERYINRMSKLESSIFFQCFEEMKKHAALNQIESVVTPTLIMGGDHDKMIPNYLQYVLDEKMPNSELYLIKDGSHVPQVDFPETVNERILQFISK